MEDGGLWDAIFTVITTSDYFTQMQLRHYISKVRGKKQTKTKKTKKQNKKNYKNPQVTGELKGALNLNVHGD